MNKKLKQLLDSENIVNLKLAIIISNDVESIAEYMIMRCKEVMESTLENYNSNYSLLEGVISSSFSLYQIHETMLSAYDDRTTPGTELVTWTSESQIKSSLINHLNKMAK